MQLEFTLLATVDKSGNPSDAVIMKVDDKGQFSWFADTDFGPFDTWLDLVHWWRRQLSVALDTTYT